MNVWPDGIFPLSDRSVAAPARCISIVVFTVLSLFFALLSLLTNLRTDR